MKITKKLHISFTHFAGFATLSYLFVSEWITGTMQSVFKCIKSIPPRAMNAIFNEIDKIGNLEFSNNVEDPQRPDDEHGYMSTGFGDSGSPYWMEKDGISTLIAINHGTIPNKKVPYKSRGWYDNDQLWQCRIIATQVTKEMVDWIKEKETQEKKSLR